MMADDGAKRRTLCRLTYAAYGLLLTESNVSRIV